MLVVLYMFLNKKALVKGAENEKIQRAKTKSKALAKRGKKILVPTMADCNKSTSTHLIDSDLFFQILTQYTSELADSD